MPSVTQAESPTLSSGKKRRRDDNGEVQMPFFSTPRASQNYDATVNTDDHLIFHHTSPSWGAVPGSIIAIPRKARPLPSSKRARISDANENHGYDYEVSPIHNEHSRHHFPRAHPEHSRPPVSPQIQTRPAERTSSSGTLSPCHICHRKPTKKSDLDSFADCSGCKQRTCYVCIRECQGWLSAASAIERSSEETQGTPENMSASFTMHDVDDDVEALEEQHQTKPDKLVGSKRDTCRQVGWNASGHCSMICSRCCVERGSEGDVVCLGCLAGMEGA
ncbi:hypothetical protein BJ170DRAFT_13946 [Xylariales sp. AK1849]|nr:hypothetical protein BJ170DRAFT_13946 [Xylariales sp. AK1849]